MNLFCAGVGGFIVRHRKSFKRQTSEQAEESFDGDVGASGSSKTEGKSTLKSAPSPSMMDCVGKLDTLLWSAIKNLGRVSPETLKEGAVTFWLGLQH